MPSASSLLALLADPAFGQLRRSLEIYYQDAGRTAAMDGLYATFVHAGDLAFDIGAHVGDRIGRFRGPGARVVAVEPQPLCARAIRALYADDPEVTLLEAACASRSGPLRLSINAANLSVSTASEAFVRAA